MKSYLYQESEFSMENQMAWRSELPMMSIINITPKNKITTLKNHIEMSEMTQNDPKFDFNSDVNNEILVDRT